MKTVNGQRPIVKNKTYAPATGIQSDFEKVLTMFVKTKSVRYEEFVKIWRDKKLSLICAGRSSERETIEFMEECIKIAFRMFLPPYGFQARVGALYLLYGLYYTQPCVPTVKIRITVKDWIQIKIMQEEFVKQDHHDSHFILQKLVADGAFHFCATSEEPTSGRFNQDDRTTLAENLREDRQTIDDLFSDESFEQLHIIHTQYHQLKIRLTGPEASRPERSLDVLQDRFPSSITEQIQKHHERWKMKEIRRQGKRAQELFSFGEQGSDEEIFSDAANELGGTVGQRRARLKAMAFQGVKNKQRYKHRALATDSSSSPEKPAQKKRSRQAKPAHLRESIQKATREEQHESVDGTCGPNIAVAPSSPSGLLDMPVFFEAEVAPEKSKGHTGRKRKMAVEADSSRTQATPQMQKKTKTERKLVRDYPPMTGKKRGRQQKNKEINFNYEEHDGKKPKSRPIPLKVKDTCKK